MAYRSDTEALRAREAALTRELEAIGEIAARKARVERELDDVRRALGGAAERALRAPRIPLPCDVPWDAMSGDERVRLCGRCSRRVYHLSAMTRSEAAAVLERDDAACVRFYERPDGTVLTSDCPAGARKRTLRRAAAGLLGVAAFVPLAVVAATAPAAVELVSIDRLARDVGAGRLVRAEGTLVRGSIDARAADVRFALESRGVVVPVRYTGGPLLPDNFRDDVSTAVAVLVEGELLRDGTFAASSLFAKAPSGSRYAEPKGERRRASPPRDPAE